MNYTDSSKAHRGTIFVEDAEVLAQQAFEADQHILRLAAPKCARTAQPGSFIHLSCGEALPMRRPLSIMRADAKQGTIEVLYKALGEGLHLLAHRKPGERLSVVGPIGRGFTLHAERPRPLLIGGGVGIPPMVFLTERMREDHSAHWQPLVLMGSEVPFPFRARPSTILVAGMPDGVIAGMPLLDDWSVPSRLASWGDFPGCYHGFVTDLAATWLATLNADVLAKVEVFACGPTPMLKAVAQLAQRFGVPCQVSLEEYMACAVGGCAGCTVRVATPQGPAMKRVCVDGPVFDAYTVFAD